MLSERDRLWFRHKYRSDTDFCPLCNNPIRWVYDGFYWYPCDAEPVYFIQDKDSRLKILKNKNLIEGVRLYRSGMELKKCTLGLLPHIYSCSVTNGG